MPSDADYSELQQKAEYQQYLAYLSAPNYRVSRLARDIESLKSYIRARESLRSNLGRAVSLGQGNAAPEKVQRFQSITREIAEAEELRSELIRLRNQGGMDRPPAPITPQRPKSEYPYGYNPQTKTMNLPEGGMVANVRGFTQTASGELKEVIVEREGGLTTFDVKTRRPTYEQEYNDTIYEKKIYTSPLAAPPEAQNAGQLVDVINRQFESQVLVAKEENGTYTVGFNPNITPPKDMLSLVTEKLKGFGFQPQGREFVFSEKAPETAARESRTWKEIFGTERTTAGPTNPFEGYEKKTAPPKLPKLPGMSPSEMLIGAKAPEPEPALRTFTVFEFSKSALEVPGKPGYDPFGELKKPWYQRNALKTPLTEFYNRDAAGEMVQPLRDFEKKMGAEVKIGDVSVGLLSSAPWMVVSGVESVAKSAVAVGNLLYTGGRLVAEQKLGFKISEHERWVIGSELAASTESLRAAPINAMFVSATFGNMKAPAQTSPNAALGQTGYKSTGVVSAQFTDEGIVREFARPGQSSIMTMVTPKGGPGWNKAVFEGGLATVKSAASFVMPAVRVGGAALGSGATFAGIQTAVEIAVPSVEAYSKSGPGARFSLKPGFEHVEKSKEAQGRILGAGVAGAVLGAVFQTGKEFKPLIQAKGAQYKAALAVYKNAPTTVLRGAADAALGFTQANKNMWFLAGSNKAALRKLEPGNKVYIEAQLTMAGLNPYQGVKEFTRQRFKHQAAQPKIQPARAIPIYTPPEIVAGRVRYQKMMRSLRVSEPARVSSSTKIGLENVAFAVVPKQTQRQNAIKEMIREDIEYDILTREAGRTKSEQVAALREFYRTGQYSRVGVGNLNRIGLGTKVGLRSGIRYSERIGTEVRTAIMPPMERMIVSERVRTIVRVRPPPPKPPPVLIPTLPPAGIDNTVGGRKPRKAKLGKGRYAPSLAGVMLGRIERSKQKRWSGFEIRGIRPGRSRRGIF